MTIKKTPLSALVPSTLTTVLAEPDIIQGNMSLYELAAISRLTKKYSPRQIFEIGTFDGRTTLNLALNSDSEAKIFTIDLPKNDTARAILPVATTDQNLIKTNVTGARFTGQPESTKITQLYGDTATFDFSPYIGEMDLIFVDGAHTYEYVMNDSVIALKLLRDGRGLIIWHDYDQSHKGSIRALDELAAANPSWQICHIENTNLVCLIK